MKLPRSASDWHIAAPAPPLGPGSSPVGRHQDPLQQQQAGQATSQTRTTVTARVAGRPEEALSFDDRTTCSGRAPDLQLGPRRHRAAAARVDSSAPAAPPPRRGHQVVARRRPGPGPDHPPVLGRPDHEAVIQLATGAQVFIDVRLPIGHAHPAQAGSAGAGPRRWLARTQTLSCSDSGAGVPTGRGVRTSTC